MNLLYSCIIAVSMYSKVPVPQVRWTDERMSHVMSFFPITGLISGLCVALWLYLSLGLWGLSQGMAVLWASVIPILVTGGIHADGFLDTMDAIHSYGDRKKKLEILKDPHVGAFAVISMAVYMLLYAGALWEYAGFVGEGLKNGTGVSLCLLPAYFMVTERAFSGLSVVSFPSAKEEGLAASFAKKAKRRGDQAALLLWLVGTVIFSWSLGGTGVGRTVLILEAVQLLIFIWYYRICRREFGGVTGDLAGWFLQISELAGYGTLVLIFKTIGLGGL